MIVQWGQFVAIGTLQPHFLPSAPSVIFKNQCLAIVFFLFLLFFSIKEMSIAFNGGKDSMALLQVIKLALDIKKYLLT